MQAAICDQYGPPEVVRLEEVVTPAPKDHEILVRIVATTVVSGDWRVRAFAIPPGIRTLTRLALGARGPRVRILGTELSGEVAAIGKSVTRFGVGDSVIAFVGIGMRCHAEYRCVSENGAVVLKPKSLSHTEAAAMAFGGTTALYFLRDRGRIQRGQRVLVIGASGVVGSAAVQLARHFGAEVSGVCSRANQDFVRSLGATHVFDYQADAYLSGSGDYDLILNTVESVTFAQARRSLARTGNFLMVSATPQEMLGALLTSFSSRKASAGMAPERREDLAFLAELVEAKAFRPVIDRIYPLDQIVDAHRHSQTGRKKGSVVVHIAQTIAQD